MKFCGRMNASSRGKALLILRIGIIGPSKTHIYYDRIATKCIWSVNVWCGIWKSTLIDPIYFDGPLTSESYTEILSGLLAYFLEDEVSLRDLSRMWYQHDGAPTHKSAQPCTFMAQTFDTRIIGYGCQEVCRSYRWSC
ncbi:uncharacterized protein TNCV_1795951 [Trichonephila clavipes]|nr:uncharacterized protein TNCV_4170141 [Trichonephila clavipes]GFV12108.1 uncharacterized protein TNCV_1795951 [Trichonephila clavipes]